MEQPATGSPVWWHQRDGPSQAAASWPYPNYHRIVFRARSELVKLMISDWQRTYRYAPVPTSAVGQELMINFIQVEPYVMPN